MLYIFVFYIYVYIFKFYIYIYIFIFYIYIYTFLFYIYIYLSFTFFHARVEPHKTMTAPPHECGLLISFDFFLFVFSMKTVNYTSYDDVIKHFRTQNVFFNNILAQGFTFFVQESKTKSTFEGVLFGSNFQVREASSLATVALSYTLWSVCVCVCARSNEACNQLKQTHHQHHHLHLKTTFIILTSLLTFTSSTTLKKKKSSSTNQQGAITTTDTSHFYERRAEAK